MPRKNFGAKRLKRMRMSRRSMRPSLAVKVARMARDLKPEVKYNQWYNNSGNTTVGVSDSIGVQYNGASGGSYSSTYPIIAAGQGDDFYGRTGRKIRITGGIIKWQFAQQNNTHQAVSVKYWVVIIKTYVPSNWGTAPNIADFLAADHSGNYSLMSFRNPDTKKNYEVIKSGYVTVPADNYSGQLRIKSHVTKWRMPRKRAIQEYRGSSGSDMVNPAIFIFAVSNWGDTYSTKLTGLNFVYQARTYFTDI